MKHALLLLLAALTVRANVPEPTAWSLLEDHLKDTLVEVELTRGSPVRGYFRSWSPESLQVVTPAGPRELARADIRAIQVYREIPARRLRQLRRGYGERLALSRDLVFSPHAVAGLALFGISTGVRAVALPFCALGDLFAQVDWSRPSARLTIV